MYLQNKYTKWYDSIITSAKSRSLTTYAENHHILPKSLGGSNNKDNLVKLTAREHFICHWLLSKMTEGKDKHAMLLALSGMRRESKGQLRYFTKITSRVYASIKGNLEFSIETKQKMSDSAKSRIRQPHTESTKIKISNSHTGKIRSDTHSLHIKESKQLISAETRQKISDFRKNCTTSDNTKHKQSIQKSGEHNPRFGKVVSEETRRKISESLKRRKSI